MVGRGGRSKACFICRQRRVKCDEIRPTCRRCLTGGRVCTGYPEGLNFIDDNPLHRLLDKALASSQRDASATKKTPQLDLAQESLSVLGEDVYLSFLQHQVHVDGSFIDERWHGFSALRMSDCLAQRCLKSFATSLFGRVKALKDTQADGMKQYAMSLKELNGRLQQPDRSAPGETILSIAILAICEDLTATSVMGWIQHMLGLAAYFGLRGMATFRGPHASIALSAFEADRFSMIAAAVATRRPTYLASEEWKTGPWSITGAPKSQRQYLIDHAADIPGLYPDFIAYLKQPNLETKSSLCSRLEDDLQRLLESLRNWHTQWTLQCKVTTKEVTLSAQEQAKYGFGTKLVFNDMEHAYTCTIYNATVIILLELWKRFRIEQLLDSPDTAQGSPEATTPGGHERHDKVPSRIPTASLASQSHVAALEICQALLLFQSPSGKLGHGLALVIPIRMALIVFRQEPGSIAAAWLGGCLWQMSQARSGWEIGKYAMQEFAYK